MKKHLFIPLGRMMLFALLCLLPLGAIAESIPLDGSTMLLLQEEDEIHVLSICGGETVCHSVRPQHTLEACSLGCESLLQDGMWRFVSYAFSRNQHTYFLEANGQVYQWSPKSGEVYQPVVQLDIEGIPLDPNMSSSSIEVDGQMLYLCHTLSGKSTLYRFNLTTGARETLYTSTRGLDIAYGGEHQLLMMDGSKEYRFNPDTQEKVAVPGIFSGGHSLVADYQEGIWLYWGYNGLHQKDADGQNITLYALPSQSYCSTHIAITNDGKHFVLGVCDSSGQETLCFVPAIWQRDENKLTLVGSPWMFGFTTMDIVPSLSTFVLDHDQLQIDIASSLTSFADIAQQLVLQNDAFDLMVLPVTESNLSNLLRKGYYVDLSDCAAIADYVNNTYPVYQRPCLDGTHIAAMPLYVQVGQWLWNTALWQELDLGAPPTTYGELLSIIEQWLNDGLLDEYRLFADYGAKTSAFEFLFYGFFRQFIATNQQTGEALSFQSPTFVALLDQLDALRDRLNNHTARAITGKALLVADAQLNMVTSDLYDWNIYQPLLLGINTAEDATVPALLTVVVINPYSQRIALAKELLAYLADNPTATTRCVLTTEHPERIQQETSSDAEDNVTQALATWQAIYDAAKKEGDGETMLRAEDTMELLRIQAAQVHDEVTPASAAVYYAALPSIEVLHDETYGFLCTSGEELLSAFIDGRINALTLAKRLDQLLQMQALESQ